MIADHRVAENLPLNFSFYVRNMKAQVQSWAFLLSNYIYSHIFHGKIHTHILTHIPFFTDHMKIYIRKLHNLRKKFILVPILVRFFRFPGFPNLFHKDLMINFEFSKGTWRMEAL